MLGDMAVFQGAISGLKVAANIAKAIKDLQSLSEVQAKAIELQSVIMEAQSGTLSAQQEQFVLIDRIRALEEKVADMKAWDETKKRYSLKPTGAGSFAYALNKECETAEPAHWICTTCYENAKRSILQLSGRNRDADTHACYVCKSEFRFPGTFKWQPQ